MTSSNSESAIKKIVICGPTCSGKSALALRIAQKINGVIINADSQQVYEDLPILSAQPSEEEKKLAPHYLYGILPGSELCTVGRWLDMVKSQVSDIGSPIIFCGGTGLYFNALLYGLSQIPEISADIRTKVRNMDIAEVVSLLGSEADGNPQRMRRALEVKLYTNTSIKEWHKPDLSHPWRVEDFVILHVNVSRETVYDKINARLLAQVENGALTEVSQLAARNLDPDLPIMKAHGVPEFIQYLEGKISLDDALVKAQQNVRNYAKRQMTWFRNQLPHKIDTTHEMSDKELYEIIR